MLQIAYIRENKEEVVKKLAKKNLDAKAAIDEVIALDEKRRATQAELDTIKSESNKLSKDIGDLMKSGEKAKGEILKEKSVQLREKDKELMVKRDIDLLRYTGSKLHITGVSSATTIELVRAAKKEGLSISCSVTPTHLFYCDEDMTTYNTNLKVIPPVRTKADREALRVAVVDGTIDCIASHHAPQDWDHKVCEFEYAEFGNIGLQTTYATLEQTIPGLKPDQISNLLSGNARRIFDLPTVTIQAGQAAELTIFNRTEMTTLTPENNKSKSSNSAFMNQSLTGKVIATINKGILTN